MDSTLEKKIFYISSCEDFLNFRIDLQLFANPEEEGRTEDPSEKKLREAREKGQTAKTDEFPQALVVIMGFLLLFFTGSFLYDNIARMTVYYLSNFGNFTLTYKSFTVECVRMVEELSVTLLPLFAVCFVAAVLGNVVQVGFQFSSHPLQFDLSKIKFTPDEVMKKIFFSRRIFVNLFKSIFKVLVIGFCSYLIISSNFQDIISLTWVSIPKAISIVSLLAIKIILWAVILLVVMAIPDYYFQKIEFTESLMMSKQEVKEEVKEQQGDPQMRSRLREMQRAVLTRSMIREVPKADVIVTNPTHFAVALIWNQDTMSAPSVIAKGVDSIALKIKEIAKKSDVMIIENRPLAQELYKSVDVGDIIPENLFRAVIEIYKILYDKGRLRQVI